MAAALLGPALVTVLPGAASATTRPAQRCEEVAPRFIPEPSYALARFAVEPSWRISTGRGVTVAVVDSGVAVEDGHLRDVVRPGRSFVPGDADPTARTDLWGHGTAVAGIIAARPVKGSGMVGLAPSASVLPVRVYVAQPQPGGSPLPPEWLPDATRMAEGIAWAARNGADVINVSMSTTENSPALRAAVKEAVRRDVVVVASAGNRDAEDEEHGPRFPAALPGVVGVAASDGNDTVTDDSVHGEHVDVYAPGQAVLATYKLGGDCLVGPDRPYTSYAAAYVSGVAALLRAEYPQESAEEIVYRMLASADRPVRDRRDDVRGWGMVHPYEALTLTVDPARPGPPVPGAAPPKAGPRDDGLVPLRAAPDPLVPLRHEMVWWLLLGAGAVALAFVLRPWTASRTRGARD